MGAKNHPAYGEELERLKYTLEYVKKDLQATLSRKEHIDDELDRAKKGFSTESSDDYVRLMVNTMLQNSSDIKIRNLYEAQSRPYFARIDFKEGKHGHLEKLYIGKMALIREEDQELIIIDWRAPIANLYYEGRIGDVSYSSPGGMVEGQLILKRQFSVDAGELKEIFDIDITTNDEFLQKYLGANAGNRLKEIVSTIQVEQNKIIRAEMWKPLIVQGAAGSGKTTIALHRIAYLIYTYEKSFTPENFMIIASNKLFLNYISNVLPELGVEKVKQTTFEDFAIELIGQKFKLRDTSEKLVRFVNHNITAEEINTNNLMKKMSEFKSSMKFKEILDKYIAKVEEKFIPNEDFMLDKAIILKYEDINSLFYNEYKRLPIVKRIEEIKKHLSNKIKLRKDKLLDDVQKACDIKVKQIKAEMEESEERRRKIVGLIDKKDEVIDRISQAAKSAVKDYIAKINRINPFEYYKDFFENEKDYYSYVEGIDSEVSDFTREYTLKLFKSSYIELEDLAPIIYLKYKIHGIDEKVPVKHIVMDEAQDFSVFQFYVLKKIVKDSSFTILGDLCQGIHSYRGTKNWKDVMEHAFEERSQYLTLEQSYRTTVEIMGAANKVISRLEDENLVLGHPVIRHGDKVEVIKRDGYEEIAKDMAEKIRAYRKDGYKSVALIGKTEEECKIMLRHLSKYEKDAYIITGKEKEYNSGVVIVPSYLSKGLEFDAVLIANANEENYRLDELDIKLLYVAMTRPLHKLLMYYHGEPSELIKEI